MTAAMVLINLANVDGFEETLWLSPRGQSHLVDRGLVAWVRGMLG